MDNKAFYEWDDDVRFDRLVDGELSHEEYRRLLRSLDDEPDGWRKCALAFLEAQALGQEFGGIRDDSMSSACRPSPVRPVSTAKMFLAMAASFLVALGLGVVVRDWFAPAAQPAGSGRQAAVEPAPREHPPHKPERAEQPAGPDREEAPPRPVGSITLVVDGGDGAEGQNVELPVYDFDESDDSWLTSSPLPRNVAEAFRRMGHEVRGERHFVPVETDDGHQVVIPVDQLEIVPASQSLFQ